LVPAQIAVNWKIVTINKHRICYEIRIVVTTKSATSSLMSYANLSVFMPSNQGGATSERDHISCLHV